MQINLHSTDGNQFNSYSNQSVTINQQTYTHNLIVSNDTVEKLELVDIHQFTIDNISILTKHQPDLIIFGISGKIKSPQHEVLLTLRSQQIGFEIMSIAALCRTFNYLVGEGRRTVGVILF